MHPLSKLNLAYSLREERLVFFHCDLIKKVGHKHKQIRLSITVDFTLVIPSMPGVTAPPILGYNRTIHLRPSPIHFKETCMVFSRKTIPFTALILVLYSFRLRPENPGAHLPPLHRPNHRPALPTPTPSRRANSDVCLGTEPSTPVHLRRSFTRPMERARGSVHGPIDRVGYIDQPVILSQVPSTENGDVISAPAAVKRGQMVLNADGNLTALGTGTSVLPAGCTDPGCQVTWDGTSPLEMDQQRITFRLLDGITWSDGEPLTADDSVFSFELASDPATPVNQMAIDRTESYTAIDDKTVVWTGIPGYRTDEPAVYFFIPQPRHAWGQISAADLLTAEQSSRKPLAGAQHHRRLGRGEKITLTRNPNYFRAGEGLPHFDRLTYRFLVSRRQHLLGWRRYLRHRG